MSQQRAAACPLEAFAGELRRLTGLLDPREGWYAVFAGGDPAGLRDCLEGREVPPWDVLASLLHDVAVRHGAGTAHAARRRLGESYPRAVAAYDERAGGEEALRGRLRAAEREREAAAVRERGLLAEGASASEAAWARDYRERTEARCAELRARLEGGRPATPVTGPSPDAGPAPDPDPVPAPGPAPAPVERRARGGGSRFAGVKGAGEDPGPSLVPPGMEAGGAAAPQGGARFAGAVDDAGPVHRDPDAEELDVARERARDVLRELAALHRADRAGGAHVRLCAAARGPALELAVLVGELDAAGWAADGTTLLWEAACLPPRELAAAADALAATGRDAECAQLLRQGVARPVEEVAEAALELHGAGRFTELGTLLAALIRSRTPVETASAAHAGPRVLVPALLSAAREVSPHAYDSTANALRGTGLPGVPEHA